jgi:hypothetical protein
MFKSEEIIERKVERQTMQWPNDKGQAIQWRNDIDTFGFIKLICRLDDT